jgi:hypothetical protein
MITPVGSRPVVRAAVGAAVTVAAEHGLRCSEPVVLSDSSNVVVHLAPSPVVARVATTTGLVRSNVAATMAKDLALADYLAGQGAAVVAPSPELPTGPHTSGGYPVTFWTCVEHEQDHTFRPEEVGPLLAELHHHLRDFPGDLPDAPPLDVPLIVEHLRESLTAEGLLTEDDLAGMLAAHERVQRAIAATGDERLPLHGDAHPANLLFTTQGPMWTDFEDAWRGPIEWDLVCLATTGRLDGRAAVATYPDAPDDAALAPYLEGRLLQGLAWSFVYQHHFPSDERRSHALNRLARWRESGR